jgi:ABC-type lipoprotein export system ATPase subunit
MNSSPLLTLRSVSKTYAHRRERIEALRNISLEVRRGEFARVTGPSGSGKTTLLNLIAALDRPDVGQITVAGSDVTRLSLTEAARYRNRQVGIVFQSYNLIPQLTALENVLLPMIPKRQMDHQRALELLNQVGLGDRSNHQPSQLSGGEQQRVVIARALANDPELILADEPTGNLDDENSRIVLDLLLRLCREHGKTLILVAHDTGSMHQADSTFELRAGRLIAASVSPQAA